MKNFGVHNNKVVCLRCGNQPGVEFLESSVSWYDLQKKEFSESTPLPGIKIKGLYCYYCDVYEPFEEPLITEQNMIEEEIKSKFKNEVK